MKNIKRPVTKIIYLFSLLFLVFILISSCGKGYVDSDNIKFIGQGDDKVAVVTVKGSPYEMGYQLGSTIPGMIKRTIYPYLKIAQVAMSDRFNNENLDKAWESVSPYIKDRFKEELKGVADGSGVSLKTLQRAHMIPVLGDYACSGVAVWGNASEDGHLYQIRNLDFTMHARLQKNPVIVVYLPDEGHAHVLPTFAGYIAAHSGMNDHGIVLSEKGASPKKDYPFDLDGTHFSTLFRDILYDADNLDEALEIVETTKLIKRYRFYIGDGQEQTMGAAKILVSTPDSVKLHVWKGNDPNDEMAPNMVENTIYYTMNNDTCYSHLQENTGTYNAQKMIELSRILGDDGGNLENIVYDATTLKLWVAYAENMQEAKYRDYVELDFGACLK